MSAADLLRRVSLFADLRDDELAALARRMGRSIFDKNMILFHKASQAQSLFILESGAVRIFVPKETGQEITLDIYGPGDCFGETDLLDGKTRSTGAIALQKTVVHTLRRNDFLRCLELHPQVSRRLAVLLARRLERATTYAENLAFLNVAGRVAAVLLELASRHNAEADGVKIDLRLTQTDIATWVCASREMVNKVLNGYQKEGLIAMRGHTIWVVDPDGLRHEIIA